MSEFGHQLGMTSGGGDDIGGGMTSGGGGMTSGGDDIRGRGGAAFSPLFSHYIWLVSLQLNFVLFL